MPAKRIRRLLGALQEIELLEYVRVNSPECFLVSIIDSKDLSCSFIIIDYINDTNLYNKNKVDVAKGDILLRKAFIEMQKEKPDFRNAFELLTKASKNGNSEALYAIGTWYLHGTFVKKTPKLAFSFGCF